MKANKWNLQNEKEQYNRHIELNKLYIWFGGRIMRSWWEERTHLQRQMELEYLFLQSYKVYSQ